MLRFSNQAGSRGYDLEWYKRMFLSRLNATTMPSINIIPQISLLRRHLLSSFQNPQIKLCLANRYFVSFPVRQFSATKQYLQSKALSDWVPSKYSTKHFFNISRLRSLIRISGPDAAKFANGLCTSSLASNIPNPEVSMTKKVAKVDGFYTSFLNPQGRVFFDGFIYNPLESNKSQDGAPELLLEVSSEMKEQALLHLTRYKLLSKVKIQDVSEQYSVVSLAGPEVFAQLGGPLEEGFLTAAQANKLGASYASWDHRFRSAELGVRLIIPTGNAVTKEAYFNADELPCSDYALKMASLGIGETPRGIVPLVSLPMECNLELLNGINFRKGCYVGQELTIRTHHKGVIRKRLVPARLIGDGKCAAQLIGADLFLSVDNRQAKRKPIGRVTWVDGQQILALMRLEALPKPETRELTCEFEADGSTHEISLEFSYPPWIRSIVS